MLSSFYAVAVIASEIVGKVSAELMKTPSGKPIVA
jgi:hypothetical protein